MKQIKTWVLACAGMVLATCAMAQGYPNRPVRLIVPAGPGSVSDILARSLAQDLPAVLGQSVVVENRAGASGFIGAEAGARAAPDGYTLFMGTAGIMTINPHLHARMPYDPVRSFTPVALVASMPNVLVVSPTALPVRTVAELVAHARSGGNRLSYGTFGTGSTPHLTMALFALQRNLELEQVPYRSSPQALNDLMSGNLSMMFDTLGTVLPLVSAGTLRALAVSSRTRSTALPEVPTMEESGFPGFEVIPWYGLYVPAGTDPEVVRRLTGDVVQMLGRPEVRQRLAGLGLDAGTVSGPAFGEFERAERDRWGEVIRAANIRIE
ncbi:Bug family tripartite tricarboxylate transporter substrate binding protein [Muricoccus aerilatus]|uniref:Bug family tripartite tricarboxylate transporter substrate binding protein n=1 Tax=Muricoccus aerilatus TaxID=452982 RepID=UPI0005C23ECF|nr:tripartite tricarboxylate transporter substrate binding protein [Roseomonas aerilata]